MQSSGTQTFIGYKSLPLLCEGAGTYLTMILLLKIKTKTTFVENECHSAKTENPDVLQWANG